MAIAGRAFAVDPNQVPSPPRRPGPRARRLLFRLSAGGRAVIVIVGGAFTAMGLLFAVIFAGKIPSDLAIALDGRTVQGRVISAELDQSVRINGRHPILATFQYTLDGQTHTGESSSNDRALMQLKKDEPVTLEVAALNPSWARLPGTTRSWTGYFGSLVLVFPLIGMIMLFIALRGWRRVRWVYVHGRAVRARVVSLGPDTSVRINGRHPFRLTWEFVGADDEIHDGSLTSMHLLELEPFAKQGEVIVLHDPANPRLNTLYLPERP